MCTYNVRNNGQHSEIVRPFWHFVQPKNVWVRHSAEHNLMFIAHTVLLSLFVDAHLLWYMCTPPQICLSKSEIVRPKIRMLGHLSISHLLLISNTAIIILVQYIAFFLMGISWGHLRIPLIHNYVKPVSLWSLLPMSRLVHTYFTIKS